MNTLESPAATRFFSSRILSLMESLYRFSMTLCEDFLSVREQICSFRLVGSSSSSSFGPTYPAFWNCLATCRAQSGARRRRKQSFAGEPPAVAKRNAKIHGGARFCHFWELILSYLSGGTFASLDCLEWILGWGGEEKGRRLDAGHHRRTLDLGQSDRNLAGGLNQTKHRVSNF